ncbi:hypothetical protein ET445_09480 [Agromyces protaetiae]|uniref:DUF1918 domain-containing protein n=1 Tax=Agromyces protaetiae TaxID=2509455 RepID=A0A4P6FCJ8_9MICO|nr:hypothetical protein [Agromyces protaetiae]QAY73535.1 hypothetical protein ET445_09480 [Agromyces protaetiae]
MEVIELRQTRELAAGDTLVNVHGRRFEVTKLVRVGRGIRVHYLTPEGDPGFFTAAPDAMSRVAAPIVVGSHAA